MAGTRVNQHFLTHFSMGDPPPGEREASQVGETLFCQAPAGLELWLQSPQPAQDVESGSVGLYHGFVTGLL